MSITAHGGGLINGIAGSPNKFTVFVANKNVSGLTCAFEGPSKPTINFSNQPDGSVEVSYVPKVGGEYKIHIKYDNRDIIGSPFKTRISGDPSVEKEVVAKLKCSGPNICSGQANANNEIYVDCKEAGITGGLNFAMEGPAKPDVTFKDNKDGTLTVQYKPPQAGDYRLHLKFGDIHLPGSPFEIRIV